MRFQPSQLSYGDSYGESWTQWAYSYTPASMLTNYMEGESSASTPAGSSPSPAAPAPPSPVSPASIIQPPIVQPGAQAGAYPGAQPEGTPWGWIAGIGVGTVVVAGGLWYWMSKE